MAGQQTIELPIRGMDCAECTQHVREAIAAVPGVTAVDVFLASEKAIVRLDLEQAGRPELRAAVESAGYAVAGPQAQDRDAGQAFTRQVLRLLGLVFGAVLLVVIAGEWLGLLEQVTSRVPFAAGALLALVAGYPVFANVIRAALRRQVIAHTLMSVGVVAALLAGEWATAAVVVFFMRLGDYVERFTTERARGAVRKLAALAPQTARLERDGAELELPAAEVREGEVVVVRPGEKVPVDGEVISGQATLDQAAITGEAMPVEAGPGSRVFAATIATLGSLRVRVTAAGEATTFGRVVRMVEEAEAHRADVQRIADRFSAYYLPVVAAIAALTFLIRRDPLATTAVLVVACSCSFALATPIALLASIGAAARRGLLIKGGKYIEALDRVDLLLIDKTGTLTLGRPRIARVVALDGAAEDEILLLAASAERFSEHPLAEAVRAAAVERGLTPADVEGFEALPGRGVRALVAGRSIAVGRGDLGAGGLLSAAGEGLASSGHSLLYVARDGETIGLLAATDTLRPEVPAALAELRRLGIRRIELLTGDNEAAARALAGPLDITYRAGLLPADKLRIVKEYQAAGHVVAMVGDGVNDAAALAQAHAGIAMGAAGADIAVEAAHVALLRDDWRLVPEVFAIARRTMRVVRANIGFTAVYNLAGLSLAAFGFLPPILAAAAQSLPDLGILANSSRLLRQRAQTDYVYHHGGTEARREGVVSGQ